jgi:hypothetical protein
LHDDVHVIGAGYDGGIWLTITTYSGSPCGDSYKIIPREAEQLIADLQRAIRAARP